MWNGHDSPSDVVLQLKLEHIIVLEALERANLLHGRVVSVLEIADSLSDKDKKRLGKTYVQSLNPCITKILELLRARGLIFSVSDGNRRNFHGSVNVLDSGDASVPAVCSRRYRVLGLVREAVQRLGRAVRNSDIIEQANLSENVNDLARSDITHDVLSLYETGELSVVGRVRGEGKGINLYLPADMDISRYKPTQPLTWLDEVAQMIMSMWAERVEEAKVTGARPKPFTTSDVRARVYNSPFYSQHELKKDPQLLVNAMAELAKTHDPLLRKIKRRGQKALLWVPAEVPDKDVDFGNFYANDSERLSTAVERAVARLGRPATVRDVKNEIEQDFALTLCGKSDLYQALSNAAKQTYSYKGKRRPNRVIRRIYRIGNIGGAAYYDTNDAPEAHAYIVLRQMEQKWSDVSPAEELTAIKTVSLPWVAKGRVMLLVYEIEGFRREVDELLSCAGMDRNTRYSAEILRESAKEAERAARLWLTTSGIDSLSTPADVARTIPVWTVDQLFQAVKPFYPLAQSITEPRKLIPLFHDRIRRVRNPHYEKRFSSNPLTAAEFFFDRTDALLYAAKQWGGSECSLQAVLAANELGNLRDPRFIYPSLESKSFETRLAGIACLAFLWSEKGNEHLRRIAIEDVDYGVRQSALWAFGFAGGEDARELLIQRSKDDSSHNVREFARNSLESGESSWWTM